MTSILSRGFWAASLVACMSFSIHGQTAGRSSSESQDIIKLRQTRDKALQILEKIETGKNPCYTDECQNQKAGLVADVFRLSTLLPEVGQTFLTHRDAGIDAGYRLIRKRFVPPPMRTAFPETLQEWKQWWMKRYDHELEVRSEWMQLTSDIYGLQQALKIYLDLAKGSEEQRGQIEEAWDRGLARAAQLLTSFPKLVRDAQMADAKKQSAMALALRNEASKQIEEFNALNRDQFGGQFYGLLTKLIPQAKSEQQVIAFLVLIQEWKKISLGQKIFDNAFVNEMKFRNRDILEMTRAAQAFNDLEYGVVGLKNFYSEVNPALRSELELIYQGFLDKVDETARQIVDIGSLYFLNLTGAQLFGPGVIGQYAFPTAASLFSNQMNFEATEILWSRSNRTRDLRARQADLEADMQRRHTELLETYKVLKIKIRDYDQELNRRTQGDLTYEKN